MYYIGRLAKLPCKSCLSVTVWGEVSVDIKS